MARKTLVQRSVTPAAFATMKRSLGNCSREVEKLKSDAGVTARRIAFMQAELEHLREVIRGV